MHPNNKKIWIICIGAFCCIALYFSIVDQKLVYHFMQPFFSGNPDWNEVISSPGFFSSNYSSFIFQFFYLKFAGPLILTTLIMLWCLCLYLIISRYFEFHLFAFALLFTTLPFIAAHSFYNYPFQITLSYLLAAGAVLIYDSIIKNNFYYNLIYAVIVPFITYIISGSAGLLVFVSLSTALLIIKKKYSFIPIQLIVGFIIPVVFSAASDTLPIKYAFSGNLSSPDIPVLIYLMPAFLVLTFLLPIARDKKVSYFFTNPLPVIILLIATMLFSFQKEEKKTIQVDQLAFEQKWDDIIELTNKDSVQDLLTQFHINRALYHTGLLLEKMFEYPQSYGTNGLQPERNYSTQKIEIQTSDLYYEMGFLNGAMHWANEAYMMSGNNPRILQRLTDVYLISHQYNVAEKFIKLMEKSLVTKTVAKQYKQFLYCDSCVLSNPEYKRFYESEPKENFYTSSRTPEHNLIKLSPNNEMAFEYLMAFYLLVSDIQAIDSLCAEIKKFGYNKLPSVCEEARLLYLVKKGLPVKTTDFQQKTLRDFQTFDNILFTKYNGDIESAKYELQLFKNTYWYYYLYNSKNKKGLQTRS